MYTVQDGSPKEKKTDRVLVLQPEDGKKPISSTGLTDPRLFTGDNALHVVLDQQTCLWEFKYDKGGLPEALKQKFTSFKLAKEHAENYYGSRNVEIVKVVD